MHRPGRRISQTFPPHAVSLAEKKTMLPEEPSYRPGKRETGERGAKHTGLLLVVAGMLFMSPAVPDALAAPVPGSEGGDELHGPAWGGEVVGLGGADEVYGGPDRDLLLAGEGDDFVETSDGERDVVLCGPGADTASVDYTDLVSSDCEAVYPG